MPMATKRTPTGAAVPGAYPRPIRFPVGLFTAIDEATDERLRTEAQHAGVSKAALVRHLLRLGFTQYTGEVKE